MNTSSYSQESDDQNVGFLDPNDEGVMKISTFFTVTELSVEYVRASKATEIAKDALATAEDAERLCKCKLVAFVEGEGI